MSSAQVPMDVDQGEDWTTDIIWTDEYDEPVYVVHPCRMDIKTRQGQTVVSLSSQAVVQPGTIPPINLSPNVGLIQLHMTKEQTAALLPGVYNYDMFVTCDDGDEYSGTQRVRLISGSVTVSKRYTRM